VVKARIERRVRFGDTDPFGVLYFAALLDYFKESVDECIRQMGDAPERIYLNRDERFGFPVVRVEADYLRPVRYDEPIIVECSIDSVGERSVTFAVVAYAGDDIASKGRLTFAAISDEWKSIPLPQRISKLVKSQK
jgi:acyl-CoA thioester hydrolase